MRFDSTADVLHCAAADAARAVSSRSSVLVLTGLMLEADGGHVAVTGTDMTVTVHALADAAVAESGRIVVAPAKGFVKTLKALGAAAVTVELEEEPGAGPPEHVPVRNGAEVDSHDGCAVCSAHRVKFPPTVRLVVRSGPSTYRFGTVAAEDFPRVPVFVDHHASIGTAELLGALGRVLPCASKEDYRPMLQAVRCELKAGRLTVCATDSYRLAVDTVDVDGADVAANVPAVALAEVARFAKARKVATVGLAVDGVVGGECARTRWSVGPALCVIARSVDGTFPNWRQLRPDSYAATALLPRVDALAAVERLLPFATGNTPVRLKVSAFPSVPATLGARDADGCEAEETVYGTRYALAHPEAADAPLEMTCGFNPQHLRDALKTFGDADEIRVRLISPLRPAVFLNGREESFYLVMPVRLPGA